MENSSTSGGDYEYLDTEVQPFSFSAFSQHSQPSQISQAPDVELHVSRRSGESQAESLVVYRSFSDYRSFSSQNSQYSMQQELESSTTHIIDVYAQSYSPVVRQDAFHDIKLLSISPVQYTVPYTQPATDRHLHDSQTASFTYIVSPVVHTAAKEAVPTDLKVPMPIYDVLQSPSIMIPVQLTAANSTSPNLPRTEVQHQVAAYLSEDQPVAKPVRESKAEWHLNVFPLLKLTQSDKQQDDVEFDSFVAPSVDWQEFVAGCKGSYLQIDDTIRPCRNFVVNSKLIKGVSAESFLDPLNRLTLPQKGFY